MNWLGNYFSDTIYQEMNELKTPDEEFYYIEFENGAKREVNPFKLWNFLYEACKPQIKGSKTDSKNWFSFKVKTTGIENKLRHVNKFADFPSKISFHRLLNRANGIIYIQNYEFNYKFK